MAFVWVPQWVALPVIVEDPMGDASNESGLPPSEPARSAPQDVLKASASSPAYADSRPPITGASFQPQHSLPHSTRSFEVQRPALQQSMYAYNMPQPQPQGPSPFNMSAMAGALPDYTSPAVQPPHTAQRGISGASTSAVVYQLQQISQYPAQAAMGFAAQPSFGSGYAQSQFSPAYPPFASNSQRPVAPAPMPQSFTPYHQPQQFMYYPHAYAGQASMAQPPVAYGASVDARRASLPSVQAASGFGMDGAMATGSFVSVAASVTAPNMAGDLNSSVPVASGAVQDISTTESDAGHGSLPRGPPRKPRQSGHALWVGNLPPGTTVTDLKDHFSREATKDIESLFLISKSNCAFVNYKTEASCSAAMHRFHDSRFHGVRLVCRLRRSAAPASGVPTGPSAMSIPRQPSQSPQPSISPQPPKSTTPDGETSSEKEEDRHAEHVGDSGSSISTKAAEKFFIVKSLTLQDLELSVRNGIWATQAHNEEALNKAYQSAENVYLIFSANKSGEYFGYARMASPISDNGIDLIHSVPEAQASEATDTPKSIPTSATEWAPKGRIIDDSARGTIFWEADLSDEEEEDKPDSSAPTSEVDSPNAPQTWGKPFRIEWVSTNRLPFYRTRGLRNPWNANREVKIARDGTELEPSVGKRLVQMFHRLGPPTAGSSVMPLIQVPSQLAGTQMRPF